VNDPTLTVACPTCEAQHGNPCRRENGNVLLDAHLARKTLASVRLAQAARKKPPEAPPER
jgi:hypothetical protein